jgi:hypothetical protein
MLKTLRDELSDLKILHELPLNILFVVPTGKVLPNVAKSKSVWMYFLSQNSLLRPNA